MIPEKNWRKVPTYTLKSSNSSVWNIRKWKCCHRLRSLFTFYANSETEVVKRTEKKGKTSFILPPISRQLRCLLPDVIKTVFSKQTKRCSGHLSFSLSLSPATYLTSLFSIQFVLSSLIAHRKYRHLQIYSAVFFPPSSRTLLSSHIKHTNINLKVMEDIFHISSIEAKLFLKNISCKRQ